MAIRIGRICVKIAGRDAGKKCAVIDILDDKFVLIDGETRRRKCNILHLEPLSQEISIGKNASHEEVAKALKEIGLEARQSKPKQKTQKPIKKRKTSEELRAQKAAKKPASKPKKSKEGPKEATLEDKAGVEEKEAEKEKLSKPKKAAKKKES